MIEPIPYFTAVCDSCGNRFGWFALPCPQDVTREVVDRYGWTACGDLHHCGACPPICSSCGLDDIDCDCIPPVGDSGLVSREPRVIDEVVLRGQS